MRKRLLVAAALAVVLSIPLGIQAYADDTQNVTASVSALAVSLTVNPGSIDYGTMAFETSRTSTAAPGGSVTFTATNTGNAPENFLVHGANATGTGLSWALTPDSLGCGVPASRNRFRHSVKVGVSPAMFLSTTSDDTLASGVAALTGTVLFTSELYMPCSGSGGSGNVASTTITVVAVS